MDSDGQLVFESGNRTLKLKDIANLFQEVSSLRSELSNNVQLVASLSTSVAQSHTQLTSFVCASQPAQLLPFQTVPTSGAYDWEYFSINSQSYLAVANYYDSISYNINSQIFRFNGTVFVPFQFIPTSGAVDWEFFTINNQSYLAVANNDNGAGHNINSQIFKFNGTDSVFEPFQSILTSGALDWEFFTMSNQSYLAMANHFSGSNHNIDSQIFKFNGTVFVPFQSIPTNGATDWEYFSIDNQSYLAVANYYNDAMVSYNINSQIFKFNGTAFVPF